MSVAELFGLTLSPWEIILRGSAVYWFLFLIFRVVMRREVGAVAVADVLLIVLIADASQNAMAGEYRSITDGFLLIATLVGWNYLLDWAGYRSPRLARWLEPPALLLVSRGRMLRRNMRRELIGVDELMSKLREKGVATLGEVERAYLETDGSFSVIRADRGATDEDGRRRASQG